MNNQQDNYKLLAKSEYANLVFEILEDVKQQIADIRTPLNVRKDIENEVRLGVIEILDSLLINKLKVLAGKVAPELDENT